MAYQTKNEMAQKHMESLGQMDLKSNLVKEDKKKQTQDQNFKKL